MSKYLVVVESPAKAKTIERYLGDDYSVKASMGHIIDLPADELAVDIDNDFRPLYKPIPNKQKTIRDLQTAAKKAEHIYLACDPDREGESIAFHIASILKDAKYSRVLFNEITKTAIIKAMANPSKINDDVVNAQQARRILDRLVGYLVSPILWKTISKGLSAGRVQTVALRLIVERELEIRAFVPEEYWTIEATLKKANEETFKARLEKYKGKKLEIKNKEDTERIYAEIKKQTFVVDNFSQSEHKRQPSPPFITSTLQQEAVQVLKIRPKQTMSIAQQLYEGIDIGGKEGSVGLITYMRTDSLRISPEAVAKNREFIEQNYSKSYLAPEARFYKNKSRAQDAHEAIRPTDVYRTPDSIKAHLTPEQYKIYSLIWRRFVASQMANALLNNQKATIKAGDYSFLAGGVQVVFDGFFKVYPEAKVKDILLPTLAPGEKLDLSRLTKTQNFTKPPARYNEATLIKALESFNIGRPSTYATIVTTLFDREYISRKDGKLLPTDLGEIVEKLLIEQFPELFEVKFTARMEDDLDSIENGDVKWVSIVREFYDPFAVKLKAINKSSGEIRKSLAEDTGRVCPECGKNLVIKWGKQGKFIACSGYPTCRYTESVGPEKEEIKKLSDKYDNINCEACGSKMVVKKGRAGYFLGCSNYPACKNVRPIDNSEKIVCPNCEKGNIVQRRSKRGKTFYGCSNYPDCNFVMWDKPVLEACPNCNNSFMAEGRKGKYCPVCKEQKKAED